MSCTKTKRFHPSFGKSMSINRDPLFVARRRTGVSVMRAASRRSRWASPFNVRYPLNDKDKDVPPFRLGKRQLMSGFQIGKINRQILMNVSNPRGRRVFRDNRQQGVFHLVDRKLGPLVRRRQSVLFRQNQSCKKFTSSVAEGFTSEWTMPVPADIRCTPPNVVTALCPVLSSCCK